MGSGQIPPEQQWVSMVVEMTNAAGERWRLTPRAPGPLGSPTAQLTVEMDHEPFSLARRLRQPFAPALSHRLVVELEPGYTIEQQQPPTARPLWACFNGYLGNGHVAVIVEADDEQAARLAAARALAAHPDSKSPYGDRSEQWSTVEQVERLTLPYVCELS